MPRGSQPGVRGEEDVARRPGSREVCDGRTPVSPGPWRDCLQALEDGHDTSSIYLVKPENTNRLMQVWCDQRHDPGGWTVIQRRLDGSVNFFRNWETYKVRTAHLSARALGRRCLLPVRACVAQGRRTLTGPFLQTHQGGGDQPLLRCPTSNCGRTETGVQTTKAPRMGWEFQNAGVQ